MMCSTVRYDVMMMMMMLMLMLIKKRNEMKE